MKRMVRRGAHSETQKEERFAFKAESEALMDELYDAVVDDVRLFLCIMIFGFMLCKLLLSRLSCLITLLTIVHIRQLLTSQKVALVVIRNTGPCHLKSE